MVAVHFLNTYEGGKTICTQRVQRNLLDLMSPLLTELPAGERNNLSNKAFNRSAKMHSGHPDPVSS